MNCVFLMHSMCLIIFAYSSTLWSIETTFGPRRLIMLFDPQGQEVATNSNSFALMATLIAGLEEQAAPILLSPSLWHNFVTRRHRYEELIQKDQFYKAHYGYYQQVQEAIHKLATPLNPMSYQLEQALQNINVTQPELKSGYTPIRKTINKDFVCYKTDFNPTKWIIRYIPDFAYILVPISYMQEINKNIPSTYFKSILSDASASITPLALTIFNNIDAQNMPLGPKLSVRELLLGLKIDHLEEVTDPLKTPNEIVNSKQIDATKNADLSKLFVTRRDLGLSPFASKVSNDIYESILVTWNVYLVGHGSPDKSAYNKSLLEYGYTQVTTLEQQLLEKKEKTEDIVNIQNEIEKLKKNINELQNQIASGKSTVAIAGLEVDTFKKLLGFFNTFVNTGLFFYDTCFGSGKNLEAPYQYEHIPQTYNYTIVSGASVDAPTTVNLPEIFLPPYSKKGTEFKNTTIVRNNQVDLNMKLSQNFTEYFTKLEQYQKGMSQETLDTILSTIHAYEVADVSTNIFESPRPQLERYEHYNIPLVRFPNTPWFKVVDMHKRIVSITEQSVITHKAENKPFLVPSWGYIPMSFALLVYTPYIAVPVTTDSSEMPAVLSMIGGDADHYFEEIIAPSIALSNIIKAFMPIKDQFYTKRYFIKKLSCRLDAFPKYDWYTSETGQEITLSNVVIINNDKKQFSIDPYGIVDDNNKKEKPFGVNVVLFPAKDDQLGQLVFEAIWPVSQQVAESDIPNLIAFESTSTDGSKLFTYIEQSFKIKSQPTHDYTEKLAGRTKVSTLIKEKAGSVLQKYAELKEKNPQGIAKWIATLTPAERKMIGIIRSSETTEHKPTLSKKEFETAQKTTAATGKQLPTGITKKSVSPLGDALQQLERSLHNLSQTLR